MLLDVKPKCLANTSHKVLYIAGGAGFLPSTVCFHYLLFVVCISVLFVVVWVHGLDSERYPPSVSGSVTWRLNPDSKPKPPIYHVLLLLLVLCMVHLPTFG